MSRNCPCGHHPRTLIVVLAMTWKRDGPWAFMGGRRPNLDKMRPSESNSEACVFNSVGQQLRFYGGSDTRPV